MTWQPGRDRIGELLKAGELEQVAPDELLSRRLLGDAERHLGTASTALAAADLTGAYQLAYDTLRKSATALLAAQGLRATSRGGNIAVQESNVAQFGIKGSPFRSFGRIRRSRNSYEYPDSDAAGPSADDVQDAIDVATAALTAATGILDQQALSLWRLD